MRLLSANKFIFILILAVFCIKSPYSLAEELTSPISVTIQMAQDTFTLPEPIEGKIILTSTAPSNLHAVFDINIFLNGTSQQSFSIAFKSVLPGRNSFSLEDFSIHLPVQAGQWRIVIKQQNVGDEQTAAADFVVGSAS